MTHEDAGNYALKRQGAVLDETVAASIKERITDNTISCADAHAIAIKLKVSPAEIGAAIDLLEVRICRCQLGLFGYGGKKKIPDLPGPVNPEMESAIRSSVVNGRIACATAWEIAKRFAVSKATVSAVCDMIKVKISACQLGSFR